jgi:hypothetical protein
MPGRYADDDGHSEALTEILEMGPAYADRMSVRRLESAEEDPAVDDDEEEPKSEEDRGDSPVADMESS